MENTVTCKDYLLKINKFDSSLKKLKDTTRFFRIVREDKIWLYDAHSHHLFCIGKEILNLAENNNFSQVLSDFSLKEISSFLQFLNVVESFSEDSISPIEDDGRCELLINTGNHCNLNCAYCFRNKESQKDGNIQTIKNAINFAQKNYKPNAKGFVVSFCMSSESSCNLALLKQVAKEYENFEPCQFIKEDLKINSVNSDSILKNLNDSLDYRDLYDMLCPDPKTFNQGEIEQLYKRKVASLWLLHRANRWVLENSFPTLIKKRRIPYVAFWIMTNGTCASREFLTFLKSLEINPLLISLDGTENVHNTNRPFLNGSGSYSKIIENLKVFSDNGFELNASAVITPKFPHPLKIIEHLLSLGFSRVSMTPARVGLTDSFTKENVLTLLSGYDELFAKLKNDSLMGDFRLFNSLKNDLSLGAFNAFRSRTKIIKRCNYDGQLVINSDGFITRGEYFSENKDFFEGNVNDKNLSGEKLQQN